MFRKKTNSAMHPGISWESPRLGNSFGQITGSHFRHPTEIDWPFAGRSVFGLQVLFTGPGIGSDGIWIRGEDLEHPWNIRGTSEFWSVFAGSTKDFYVVTCRYCTLLYVTVVSSCFIMFLEAKLLPRCCPFALKARPLERAWVRETPGNRTGRTGCAAEHMPRRPRTCQ